MRKIAVVFILFLMIFNLMAKAPILHSEHGNLVEDIGSLSNMAAVEIPGYGIYIFKGNRYYKYKIVNKKKVLQAGYPKVLPGGWQGLPAGFLSGIDAAVYNPKNKKTYFFKGNLYARLTGIKVDAGYPKRLPGGWSGLPATFARDIDAAVYVKGQNGTAGQIILTKGDKYVTFNEQFKIKIIDGKAVDLLGIKTAPFNRKIDAMLPKGITDDLEQEGIWVFSGNSYLPLPYNVVCFSKVIEGSGLISKGTIQSKRYKVSYEPLADKDWKLKPYQPDLRKITADAGVWIRGVGYYLFAGDQYYKYNYHLFGDDKARLLNGYPQKLPGGWQGLPSQFKKGIDAAFYYQPSKKTYMFKGNQYIRLTGVKVDPDYPRPLPGGFAGLPKSFCSGIDAAFTVPGYVVLVKNSYFVAFKNSKKVASGRLQDLWPSGLPKGYDRKINAITLTGLGQFLFSGDQCLMTNGVVTELAPKFHIVYNGDRFSEYYSIDDWKLSVRNQPMLSTYQGDNNGINVAVLSSRSKARSKKKPGKIKHKSEDNYDCSIQHIDEKVVSPDNILLDPTTDVIWPGAIVDGTSIPSGKYKLLSFKRKNYIISTSAQTARKVKATISKPLEQSHVRQQVNSIINSIKNMPTGTLSFQKEEMYGEKQFRLKFGGHYNTGVASVSAGLNIQSNTKKHRLVVEFAQKCFSIDMDDIGSYKKWVEHSEKIDFYNTLPMYVSSVTYGRRAYMSIESDESLEALETYFSGSYAGAGANLSTHQKEILKRSKVKVYIIGGNGKNAAKGAAGDYNAFIRYIKTPPRTAADVMPIAYKMRFLKDKSVAKVSLSSSYTVRNCTAYQLKYKVTLKKITCTGVDDSGAEEELYGMGWVEFYDKNGKKVNSNSKIWHRKVDNYVSLGVHQSFDINTEKRFTYKIGQVRKKKPTDDGAYILLKGWIEEDDDFNNDNDDLGHRQKKIFLNEIVNGKLPVRMTGFADGGSRAELIWLIETY